MSNQDHLSRKNSRTTILKKICCCLDKGEISVNQAYKIVQKKYYDIDFHNIKEDRIQEKNLTVEKEV